MSGCVCPISKCTTHTRAVILLHKYTHTRTCYILYIQSIWFSRKVAGVIHTYIQFSYQYYEYMYNSITLSYFARVERLYSYLNQLIICSRGSCYQIELLKNCAPLRNFPWRVGNCWENAGKMQCQEIYAAAINDTRIEHASKFPISFASNCNTRCLSVCKCVCLCVCVFAEAREINWVLLLLFSRVVRQLGKCRHMAGIYKVFTKTSVVSR